MKRLKLLGIVTIAFGFVCLMGCSPSSEENASSNSKSRETGETAKTALSTVKIGVWTQDWDAALQLAKEKKLPVLVNFTGSDWCGWCKLMDREVFSKDAWKKYAGENLILAKIDFPRNQDLVPKKFVPRNQNLAKKFGIRGYPTFVLLNSDGQTELGRLGASREITPEIFIRQIEEKVGGASARKK